MTRREKKEEDAGRNKSAHRVGEMETCRRSNRKEKRGGFCVVVVLSLWLCCMETGNGAVTHGKWADGSDKAGKWLRKSKQVGADAAERTGLGELKEHYNEKKTLFWVEYLMQNSLFEMLEESARLKLDEGDFRSLRSVQVHFNQNLKQFVPKLFCV